MPCRYTDFLTKTWRPVYGPLRLPRHSHIARGAIRSQEGPGVRIPFPPPASQSGKRVSSGRSERWVTRSGRGNDISAWSDARLFNAAGSAELSPRCGLGRTRAWAALAARVLRSGGPAANASDDAVLMQARDRGGVEAEPVGKHFFGVLAEQWRRFDFRSERRRSAPARSASSFCVRRASSFGHSAPPTIEGRNAECSQSSPRGRRPLRRLHACSGCFQAGAGCGACTHWKAPPCHGAHLYGALGVKGYCFVSPGRSHEVGRSPATPRGRAR